MIPALHLIDMISSFDAEIIKMYTKRDPSLVPMISGQAIVSSYQLWK